jgi:hypothetical protein
LPGQLGQDLAMLEQEFVCQARQTA